MSIAAFLVTGDIAVNVFVGKQNFSSTLFPPFESIIGAFCCVPSLDYNLSRHTPFLAGLSNIALSSWISTYVMYPAFAQEHQGGCDMVHIRKCRLNFATMTTHHPFPLSSARTILRTFSNSAVHHVYIQSAHNWYGHVGMVSTNVNEPILTFALSHTPTRSNSRPYQWCASTHAHETRMNWCS